MKCNSCGAELPAEATVCEYCGSRRPASPAADETASHAAVFERIRRSPEYTGRMATQLLQNLPTVGVASRAIPVVFFALFIGVAACMAIGMGTMIPGFMKVMAIVPLGMAVIGVLMFTQVMGRMRRFDQADVQALPAIVTGKRTHVSGGSGDSSATTHYRITFQLEDGAREELQPLEPSLYGRVSEGDPGILYRRAEFALDFRRL